MNEHTGGEKMADKDHRTYRHDDLENKQFGLLTALYLTGKIKNGSYLWHCRCACGNYTDVTARDLNRGVKSCGCLKKRPPESYHSIEHNLHFEDGTCIENLIASQKRPILSNTGVRGVYFQKRSGKYSACITFKKKKYSLGTYADINDAINARKNAEEKYFGSFLKAYFHK